MIVNLLTGRLPVSMAESFAAFTLNKLQASVKQPGPSQFPLTISTSHSPFQLRVNLHRNRLIRRARWTALSDRARKELDSFCGRGSEFSKPDVRQDALVGFYETAWQPGEMGGLGLADEKRVRRWVERPQYCARAGKWIPIYEPLPNPLVFPPSTQAEVIDLHCVAIEETSTKSQQPSFSPYIQALAGIKKQEVSPSSIPRLHDADRPPRSPIFPGETRPARESRPTVKRLAFHLELPPGFIQKAQENILVKKRESDDETPLSLLMIRTRAGSFSQSLSSPASSRSSQFFKSKRSRV